MKRRNHNDTKRFYEDYRALNVIAVPQVQRARAIGLLKRIRRAWSRARGKSDRADYLYLLAVLVRAYLDYLKLSSQTAALNWINTPALVEAAWDKLCDLNDRIHYLSGSLEEHVLIEMNKKSREVEVLVRSTYGPGMYTSPDMICRKVICSICGQNIRKCDHIPGRLYHGFRCTENPKDCELRSVSIVEDSADRRCRIWPWQLAEDEEGHKLNSIRIMTVFRIDDFLGSNEWEKSV
jgi:hypothetical protein